LGFVPPIICAEGGWLYNASDDARYPKVGDELHARYHQEMFNWFRLGELSDGTALPDYLFAVCPWILSGDGDEPWYGWTTKTKTIEAVKAIPPFIRGEEVWIPPTDALTKLGLERLGELPLPRYWALPAYAEAQGYPIQACAPGRFYDQERGEVWAWQVFGNEEQTEYIVAFAIEGLWSRIGHEIIRTISP